MISVDLLPALVIFGCCVCVAPIGARNRRLNEKERH